MGAQREHLPGVRVGRAGLGVQVVTVVPEHHKAEVADRREHRGAGARHDRRLAAQRREPAAVPFGGAEVGGERDVGGVMAFERLADPREVARVGHDDHHATARARARLRGARDLVRPARPGHGGPGGAGRPAGAERVEEGRPGRVPVPGSGVGPARPFGRPVRRDGFRRGVPLRDRQPQHVGERAGVPVGDGAGQPGDFRRQHRLGRDHSLEVAEPALMLTRLGPVEDEAVCELPGESDTDPHPRARHGVEPLRHQVVEGPVQMGEGDVHGDPGDRIAVGRVQRLGGFRRPGAPRGLSGHGPVLPDARGYAGPADSRVRPGTGGRNTRARPFAGLPAGALSRAAS